MAWHLIENTSTGEQQAVEHLPEVLATDEVDRGSIPVDLPPHCAVWNGAAVVADTDGMTAAALTAVRARRGELLAGSDWTQLPDSPLDAARRSAWAEYRQALRDLPETIDPLDFDWPAPPTS